MRLSRFLPKASAADEPLPLRRVLLWTLVGAAIGVGIVLYFKYERQIAPLIG